MKGHFMKTKFIFLICLVVSIKFLYPQEIGWISQNPFPPNQWIEFTTVFFLDDSTGWVGGGWPCKILKTVDGGNNWSIQSLPPSDTTQWIQSIFFITINNGWAVGGENGGENGKIIFTNNGGSEWQDFPVNGIKFLNSVLFVNEDTGFIAGNEGIIMKTTDAGYSWISKNSGTNARLNQIFFISPLVGWAVGENVALQTTDGGENWSTIVLDPNYYGDYRSIFFVSELKGWILGSNFLYTTEDGGNTWSRRFLNYDYMQFIVFQTQDTGWIVGSSGVILKTIDSGINWGRQICPTAQNLRSAFFISPTTGWVVGNYGTILKTIDGGGTTSVEHNGNSEIASDYYLFQNYPNPFNSETIINYSIPVNGFVSLKIYNVLGKEIITLVEKEQPRGNYEISFNGGDLSSGIYFYKIKANTFSQTRKFVLLK